MVIKGRICLLQNKQSSDGDVIIRAVSSKIIDNIKVISQ